MSEKLKDLLANTAIPQSARDEIARQAAKDRKAPVKLVPAHKTQGHTDGVPNGLESAYMDRLRMLLAAGEVKAFWFEAVKVRLTAKRWFLCDFLIQFADGHFEFHDTKGWMREDAALKAEFTAEVFPFPVVIVTKDGAAWAYRTLPRRGDITKEVRQ